MALSEDDKREIREEIWKGLKQFFAEQDITIAQHSEDHRRLRDLWGGMRAVKISGWITLITTGLAGILSLLWTALKSGGR